jgi:hypothetical protein
MGLIRSFKAAQKTVREVEQWGRDTKAYAEEQRVKRGEKPAPNPKGGRR